jgi:hypothetical protein
MGLVHAAQNRLEQLHGTQRGTSSEVARHFLTSLSDTIGLVDQALQHTLAAAVNAGIPPQQAAQRAELPPQTFAARLKAAADSDDR